MTSVKTTLQIAASPERVWRVLTDFDAYPAWNNVVLDMRAEAREGAAVRFKIKIEGTPALPIAARVKRCVPGREFSWGGGAPLVPSLAWAEHYFRLEPSGDGTLLTHGEDFGGLFGLAMRGAVFERVTRTYEGLNRAIRDRAEAL
jgi:hypothetical protein